MMPMTSPLLELFDAAATSPNIGFSAAGFSFNRFVRTFFSSAGGGTASFFGGGTASFFGGGASFRGGAGSTFAFTGSAFGLTGSGAFFFSLRITAGFSSTGAIGGAAAFLGGIGSCTSGGGWNLPSTTISSSSSATGISAAGRISSRPAISSDSRMTVSSLMAFGGRASSRSMNSSKLRLRTSLSFKPNASGNIRVRNVARSLGDGRCLPVLR